MSRKRAHHGNKRHGNHPSARKPHDTLTGTLHVTRPDYATVQTAEGTFRVGPRGIREGMNGDEVQVTLSSPHGHGGEKLAFVQGVLQRATKTFLGTFGVADPLGVVVPLDTRIRRDFFVLPEDDSARRLGVGEGDVVAARILQYPTRQSAGVATVERRLGSAQELDVDMEAVIASYDLPVEFPEPVLREARSVRVDVPAALVADPARVDLRGVCCVTVDPTDARDFDDAVSARRLADGGYEVGVHIADVTHYVRWDSSIDLEARRRTCSAYLADRVLPMLPEELCNDACSLRPGEDRLCMSVRMELDPKGRILHAEAANTAIRSRARLDYATVDRLLEGQVSPDALPVAEGPARDVADALAVLDEVARKREKIRRDRGAIDFKTSEAKVTLDEKGHPTGVVVRRKTRATSLIEEAMLMANESVAKMLADAEAPAAYRVHEQPAPEDLKACVPVLAELGLVGGAEAELLVAGEPDVIQRVLARAEGTSAEYLANALLLRAQKRAIYLPQNLGHYALGARAYCHFTSPIRRYPDDVVHRALKAQLARASRSPEQRRVETQLPQLCRTCSDRERIADAASRASQKVKMAELYAERVGQSFSGIVVGVERYGLFVMLDDTCAEGLLPVKALGNEWFAYDEARMCLTGEATGRRWTLGKRVAVTVTGAKVSRGQIDFALAGGSGASR